MGIQVVVLFLSAVRGRPLRSLSAGKLVTSSTFTRPVASVIGSSWIP